MRVLHVITTINRGGAENHLVSLIRGQVAAGMAVSVAYLKGDGYWRNELEGRGVVVHSLRWHSTVGLGAVAALARNMSQHRYDVIHAHLPPAELVTAAAMRLRRDEATPFIISKHNDAPFWNGIGNRIVEQRVAGCAASVIAISKAVKAYFARRWPAHVASVIEVVLYGVELWRPPSIDKRNSVRAGWGVRRDELLIGSVARLVPQKALHVLIDAFALFRQSSAVCSRLVIVGAGPLRNELDRRAKERGVQVIWAGFRPDIPEVMAALDLFALSSEFEGFGLVLLEAMVAGLAIVATKVSAIPEVVTNGVTGILTPSGNPLDMARALSFLCTRDNRVAFGEAGRKRVRSHFSLETMIRRTNCVYESSLRGRVSNGVKPYASVTE